MLTEENVKKGGEEDGRGGGGHIEGRDKTREEERGDRKAGEERREDGERGQ